MLKSILHLAFCFKFSWGWIYCGLSPVCSQSWGSPCGAVAVCAPSCSCQEGWLDSPPRRGCASFLHYAEFSCVSLMGSSPRAIQPYQQQDRFLSCSISEIVRCMYRIYPGGCDWKIIVLFFMSVC